LDIILNRLENVIKNYPYYIKHRRVSFGYLVRIIILPVAQFGGSTILPSTLVQGRPVLKILATLNYMQINVKEILKSPSVLPEGLYSGMAAKTVI
jgi:hypothetical protein